MYSNLVSNHEYLKEIVVTVLIIQVLIALSIGCQTGAARLRSTRDHWLLASSALRLSSESLMMYSEMRADTGRHSAPCRRIVSNGFIGSKSNRRITDLVSCDLRAALSFFHFCTSFFLSLYLLKGFEREARLRLHDHNDSEDQNKQERAKKPILTQDELERRAVR